MFDIDLRVTTDEQGDIQDDKRVLLLPLNIVIPSMYIHTYVAPALGATYNYTSLKLKLEVGLRVSGVITTLSTELSQLVPA